MGEFDRGSTEEEAARLLEESKARKATKWAVERKYVKTDHGYEKTVGSGPGLKPRS